MALLDIKDLNFAYPDGKYKALSHINLQAREGDFILICGQSGCGKSTLLRHMKRELMPHGTRSGRVLFEGSEIETASVGASAQNVGFVMQNIENQIVTDKVYSELAFGLESLGMKNQTMRRRVAEMASFFGIQNWFRSDTGTLSGGQKQMLNLASVMVMQPKLLVLDEPTSQLDPIAAAEFLNTIVRINANLGTTVVMTEHRLEDIYPYADVVFVMDGGQIIESGAPRAVAEKLAFGGRRHVISSAFPSAIRLFAGVKSQEDCPLTVKEGASFVKKRYAEKEKRRDFSDKTCGEKSDRKAPPAENAVCCKEIFFRYEKNGRDVLRGLNLTVKKGEIYCILGGNGTGKTTALSILCGMKKPYRGKVEIFGKPIAGYNGSEFFGKTVSALPQNPQSLFTCKTVRKELQEMTGDLRAIDQAIAKTQIQTLLDCHPYDISGGEQQKVAFAKVLLCDPKLILLDEPTKGLDAYYKDAFGNLLAALCAEGKTVVMATHDVEFAASYATKCCLFFDGESVCENTPHDFFAGNYFYTTAANRIARAVHSNAISVEELLSELNAYE